MKCISREWGYIRIAKTLNDRQIPPPGIYKQMQGLNYKNAYAHRTTAQQWRDSTVFYILRQEVYTGAVIQGKSKNISYKNKKRVKLPKSEWIIVRDMHEAIIEPDLWNSVQELLNNHKLRDKQFKSDENAEINPLKGSVYCKECGAGMWRMSYQCAKERYKYYRCKTVKNSNGICDNVNSIRQIDLEAAILAELKNVIKSYMDSDKIEVTGSTGLYKKTEALKTEKNQNEKNISKLQNNSFQLYKDKISGLFDDEQFKMLNDSFNKELKQLQKRMEEINKELDKLEIQRNARKSKDEVLEKYKNVEKLTFELVQELIEGIYVGKTAENNQREIDIKWKF